MEMVTPSVSSLFPSPFPGFRCRNVTSGFFDRKPSRHIRAFQLAFQMRSGLLFNFPVLYYAGIIAGRKEENTTFIHIH
ncbi:Hypothetical predicted protein [Pelobates cultripes]|uniref:Uncharacterized protein n=1 Tax=Pelobates cultripes TaxID=61616 RepID=A0AAD1SVC3_PELCU|nr:Hypothetical predicted protein [Pelobates cultripes]